MEAHYYRLIHVVGVLLVFVGLGGVLANAAKDGPKPSPIYYALHGIGLLALLVAGIGFVHKAGLPWANWMSVKVACWVVLGVAPILVRKGYLTRFLALLLVLAVGAGAVYLVQWRPF